MTGGHKNAVVSHTGNTKHDWLMGGILN